MYKPVQKKSSSWTPASVQKKSESLKSGSKPIQPKRDKKSSQQSEMPNYSRGASDGIMANVMRSLEAKEQEQAETPTVQPQSDSGGISIADVVKPTIQTPTPPIGIISRVLPENPIQRLCSECASEQLEESAAEGKDVEEMSVAASGIQTKLTVGAPGDKYEQEADQVAARVMRMSLAPDNSPQVQRFGEEDNPIQRWSLAQSITPLVQRQVDEQVQMRQLVQRAFQASGNEASGDLESRLNGSKGGGSALAPEVRGFMEPRFGADFSSVRVHTGGEAVQMSRELGAQAFTHERDIFFGEGKSPGNNELTAHELTHVVQQTGVGEVQKQSANEQGWKSPALQMRSQLRTSSLSRLVIQRAVTTSGGEWDTDQYDLVRDSANGRAFPPAAGVRGVDINLKFTPNENVDAELIGLTQSVQAFVNNSPNLTPAAATRAIPSKDAISINTGAGETDEGTAIDQLPDMRNPLYAVGVAPAGDTNLADTLPVEANGWGRHGFRHKDRSGVLKTQSATLIDKPRRPGAAKDSRHIFEATALAIKGSQTGTYYGSVRWGWRTDNKGNFTKIPLTVVSQGVPSSTFMKAAEIWNAAKTPTGADTLDLPIVDVKVTTAPVTLMPHVPLRNIPLPVGTRVQIIEEWHPPLLNGTIKVIDGTHTGITGQVSYQEWGNIADERP